MVEIYGNKIWNNATSNDEKTILNVEKDTLQSVLAVLESAALNYCYYIQNNICSIAVNSSDIPKLTIIPEMQHINKSSPRKNSTPQNIIGNTNYRDIREKAYQKLNTDLALKVAEMLTDSHIPFSGRIYNKNTTLTVNDNDKEKLDEIIQAVQNQRNLFRKDTENVNKIYSEINNNGFTDEQKSALIPAINLCYLKGENLSDILIYDIHEISDYSVEQLKKFSETFVDSYQNLSEYEFIFGGQEVRNLKEQIEKEILFERVTRLRGYDNEQKDAIKQLINNGVSETILGILDYNFSSDDLLKISDILKSDNVLENLYKHISDVKNIDINTLHNHFRLNTYMPDTAEIFWFMYDTETADIFEVPNKGKIVTIDIEPNRGLWNRLAEHSLLLNENSEQRILFETDGKDWNKIIIPDVFGNKTNNIDVSEILTSEELSVMQEISDKVLSGFYSQLEFEQPLSEPDVTFAPSGQKSEIPIAESDMSIKISKSEFIDFATDDKPTADISRPTITCVWSEHSAFEDKKTYSVAEFDRNYSDLKVCNTPQILLDIGCKQLPMLYTRKHLREAVKPKKNNRTHAHGLDVKQIKKLPELLENPVMIFDSLTERNSIVVVTSEIDKDNCPIIASIRANGNGTYELERIDSNFITSVYGRENFERHINRVIQTDNMLYCSKEKSQTLFSVLELQSFKGLNSLDFDTIIHQSRNIVNENTVDKAASNEQITFDNGTDKERTNNNEQEKSKIREN